MNTELFIKQHVLTIGDNFSVYSGDGSVLYTVSGEIFTFGKRLHIYDFAGREVAYVNERIFSIPRKFDIYAEGVGEAVIKKRITLFFSSYAVEEFGWEIDGMLGHEYEIHDRNGELAVTVSKKWFTLGDAYSISIADGIAVNAALAAVIAIDADIDN